MGAKSRRAPQFFAADRATWRSWLAANHGRATQVSLVFYRKATGRRCIAYDDAVQEALCFGWIDGIKHKLDDERYSFRFTPRRPGSKWSDSNKRRVALLTAQGLLQPAGIAAIERAKQSGVWDQPALSPLPATMPAELSWALAASAPAARAYDALAPSHKRNWWRFIAEGKQAETRERRAAKCVAELVGAS